MLLKGNIKQCYKSQLNNIYIYINKVMPSAITEEGNGEADGNH